MLRDPFELEVGKVLRLGDDLRVVVSPDLFKVGDAFGLLKSHQRKWVSRYLMKHVLLRKVLVVGELIQLDVEVLLIDLPLRKVPRLPQRLLLFL